MAAWKDPLSSQDTGVSPIPEMIPASPPNMGMDMGMGMPGGMGGMGLPPISSYGPPIPAWNKEMMELLVDIEIPQEYLNNDLGKRVFIWTKKILMQLQFGNYTGAIQKTLIKELQYIIFLGGQEGNEGIVAEEQLIFIANLMMLKGRSDLPDGIRERVAWIMTQAVNKSVFSDERPARPTESKGLLNKLTGGIWGGR